MNSREARARLVDDAERAVTGIDQRDRGLDDPLQHRREVQVRTDSQHGIEQLAQTPRSRVLDGHARKRTACPSFVRKGRIRAVPIRVFLLDDHEIVRRGLRELLEGEDDLEIVGEAGTAEEALGRIPPTSPMSRSSTCVSRTVTASRCVATSVRRIPRSNA